MEDIKRFRVKKQEKDDDVYFSIAWSHLTKAERYTILGSAPSMAGIYELYYREPGGTLKQVFSRWHGMAVFGNICDGTSIPHSWMMPLFKRQLSRAIPAFSLFAYRKYPRHGGSLLFLLPKSSSRQKEPPSHSGRYRRIYVREIDSDRLVTF